MATRNGLTFVISSAVMSGGINPDAGVKIIAENIKKFEKGIIPDYQSVREE